MPEGYTETVELRVTSPKPALAGLDAAEAGLARLQASLAAINRELNGLNQVQFLRRTRADFEALFRTGKLPTLGLENLAKAAKVDLDKFNQALKEGLVGGSAKHLREFRRLFAEAFSPNSQTFRSIPKAAGVFAAFERLSRPRTAPQMTAADLLSGQFGGPAVAGGSGGSGGGSGGSGRSGGTGGAGGDGGSASEFKLARTKILTELEAAKRARNVDPEGLAAAYKKAAEQLNGLLSAAGDLSARLVAETELRIARLLTASTKAADRASSASRKAATDVQRTGQKLDESESKARAREVAGFTSPEAGLARAAEQSRQRRQRAARDALRLSQGQELAGLGAQRASELRDELEDQGYVFGPASTRTVLSRRGQKQVEEVVGRRRTGNREETVRIRINIDNDQASSAQVSQSSRVIPPRLGGRPPPLPQQPISLLDELIRNTVKVAKWTVSAFAVTAAMGAMAQAARVTAEEMVKLDLQTARLDQVFRKVGGSTMALTDDVLRMAAAQGRSTDEAMDSAIRWSRLGLDRQQVLAGVKTSLQAANVAELSAAEATEKLIPIMIAYNLQASEMGTVLSGLNAISNTYNTTNQGMLDGLSRVAALAKQAGFSLSETAGIIGAVSGATGQSGTNVANALKTTLTRLANPELQKKLRDQFNFEVTTDGGDDIKPGPRILREMATLYQGLNNEQRQYLTFLIGGATQSNRVTAILQHYVQAQVLAVRASTHLNSAQEENARILSTLQARLQGLGTEWMRFANIVANTGVKDAIGETLLAMRNAMALANNFTSAVQRNSARGPAGFNNGIGPLSDAMRLVALGNRMMAPKDAANSAIEKAQASQAAATTGANLLGMLGKVRNIAPFTGAASEVIAPTDPKRAAAIKAELDMLIQSGRAGEAQALIEKYRLELVERQSVAAQKVFEAQTRGKMTAEQALQIMEEESNELEKFLATDSRHLAALERMKGTLTGIEGIYRSLPVATRSEELRLQVAALDEQAAALKRQEESLRSQMVLESRKGEEYEKQLATLNAQIQQARTLAATTGRPEDRHAADELEKQRAALREPNDIRLRRLADETAAQRRKIEEQREGVRAQEGAADTTTRLQAGGVLARARLTAAGVGLNPTQQLRAQLREARGMAGAWDNRDAVQVGSAIEANQARQRITVDLIQREAEVRREILQLAIDSNREFAKSMLTATPGEMLRKLAAHQLNQRGIQPGQFMAASPEMRQDMQLLNPNLDPRMAELRAEMAELSPVVVELRAEFVNLAAQLRNLPAIIDGLRNVNAGVPALPQANGIR